MAFGPEDMPQKKKTIEFPRILDEMSVDELKDYVAEMESEIVRVEADIKNKNASKSMADAVFGPSS